MEQLEPGAAVGLGVIQGLTEFLPVSSSGHLVLVQQFVEVAGDDVLFDLVLHVGTLLPALWFYRADVLQVGRDLSGGEGDLLHRDGTRLAWLVILATIPTGLIGVLFKDVFEGLFHNPMAVAGAFAVTGALLLSTRGRSDGELGVQEVGWKLALAIGVAQGLAITPGISRSGATIAVALLLGFRREFAVKFSFLMSVPAILGAVVLKLGDVGSAALNPIEAGLGLVAAALSGYLALSLLVRLVRAGQFSHFAWYMWAVALFALWLALSSSGVELPAG